MKPLSALLLLLAPIAPLAIQPATAQAQTHPPVHHTPAAAPAAAHKDEACGTFTPPTLPATVPKIEGCPKPLYSLTYVDTVIGTGDPVVPRRWLTVAYTGYLLDGTKFDSSVGKDPITFPYGAHQVIAGWDTGFEGMKIGGHRRLYIPHELAYGDAGRPPVIPARAELVFDVELIGISETPPAPKTPAAPPAGTPPPAGTTPPAGTPPPATTNKPATDAPAASGAQQSVGKPTTTPAPTTTAAPTDPTKPAAVPPKK